MVPCFAAGTQIDTPTGPRRVEDLRPGDAVITLDDGPQPLRFVLFHPVRFGTPGPNRTARSNSGPAR